MAKQLNHRKSQLHKQKTSDITTFPNNKSQFSQIYSSHKFPLAKKKSYLKHHFGQTLSRIRFLQGVPGGFPLLIIRTVVFYAAKISPKMALRVCHQWDIRWYKPKKTHQICVVFMEDKTKYPLVNIQKAIENGHL